MPVRMLGMGDGCRLDGQLRLDPHEMKPWSLSGKVDESEKNGVSKSNLPVVTMCTCNFQFYFTRSVLTTL